MGFFDKVARSLGKGSPQEAASATAMAASLNKDGRLHPRFIVRERPIATLTLGVPGNETAMVGVVQDLSYGGLAVRFEATTALSPDIIPPTSHGNLQVLGKATICNLKTIRLVNQSPTVLYAGFSLQHDTASTLVFLRELIEPLRWGQSLVELGPDVRHERYQGSQWFCLRGDGPTDLVVHQTPAGELQEALLTFRVGSEYLEMTYRNKQLGTNRSLTGPGALGIGAQMTSTPTLDESILRISYYVLSATPLKVRAATKAVMDAIDQILVHKP